MLHPSDEAVFKQWTHEVLDERARRPCFDIRHAIESVREVADPNWRESRRHDMFMDALEVLSEEAAEVKRDLSADDVADDVLHRCFTVISRVRRVRHEALGLEDVAARATELEDALKGALEGDSSSTERKG